MNDDEDDDFSDIEVPDYEEPPLDPVAARAEATWRGIALLDHVKDPELKAKGVMMLDAIRRSFKTLPSGDLTTIQGGKS
jgi:hypothetical protein